MEHHDKGLQSLIVMHAVLLHSWGKPLAEYAPPRMDVSYEVILWATRERR